VAAGDLVSNVEHGRRCKEKEKLNGREVHEPFCDRTVLGTGGTKVFLSAWRMANGVLVNETKDTTIRLLSKGRGLLLSTFAAILY